VVIHRPASEGVEVDRAGDGSFVVLGRAALRAVALSDLTDGDAMEYVQYRLRRLGVERALVRAGVREGDTVHLGSLTFTYHRDAPALGAADLGDPAGGRLRRTAGSRRGGRRPPAGGGGR
ncbi:MAG: Obg family GTPase CgtA, partial [Acidimicrobiales bacterium]